VSDFKRYSSKKIILLEKEYTCLTSKNIKRLRTESPPNGKTYMKTRYIQVM